MKSYVQTMQVYSEPLDELEATITCIDEGVYSVDLTGGHTIDSWRELSKEVEACIQLMEKPL